jgi:hypothetical protein
MLFKATSIFSFILPKSLHLQFEKWLSVLLPEGSSSNQPRLLPDRYNRSAKLLIFFLCFNVLLAGTNHVVCIELSDEIITKAHFQLYECSYPQNKKSAILQRHNHKAPQVLLSDLLDTTQSCPECIDAHIQFEKPSVKTAFPPAILLTTLSPAGQNNSSQPHLATRNSLVLRQQHVTLSSDRLSAIRSTVLLI